MQGIILVYAINIIEKKKSCFQYTEKEFVCSISKKYILL